MTEFKDTAFKDSSPQATVARIKDILAQHGIHTTEVWQENCVPYCHAMSIHVDGTSLKSNGKGITPEFALASGYGELMERLQMGITGAAESQKAALHSDISQIKQISAEDHWQAHHQWYEALSHSLYSCTGTVMAPKDILWRFVDSNGTMAVREYFLTGSGKSVFFPAQIIQKIYCTNGCAAGNTIEEAMVQAISEIVERHHQLRILHEDLTPPNIPEDVLMKCPFAWNTICFLREQGFQVTAKDCSFGTPFPVVCVCLIDNKTGRYHTHFGAFPVFEIALERALTESFQGRTLENVAQFHRFSTKKPGQHDIQALGNEVFFGSGEKTQQFFTGRPSYPYNPRMGFSGADNKSLLKQCLDHFRSRGYDVLVQNRAALDFPTCQVLIPGISEVMIHRLHPSMDDTRYTIATSKCLRSPATATITDAMALMMHLQQLDQFSSKVRHSRDFSFCSRIPLKLSKEQSEAMMIATLCFINYSMGRIGEVSKGLQRLIQMSSGEKRQDLESLSENLHQITPEHNPFDDLVLHCDLESCSQCPMADPCCYKQNHALSNLIAQKTKELDHADFSRFLTSL